jgi:hypothetical protein
VGVRVKKGEDGKKYDEYFLGHFFFSWILQKWKKLKVFPTALKEVNLL